jgi:uncharacterized protein (TIGR03435 family)
MKKIIIVIALFIFGNVKAQQKEINFNVLLNAPQKSSSLNALKGKVVVLEFWATWCGACLTAMPHLAKLQQTFPDKLRVITISSESEKRIGAFLKSRPSNLWFAVDTGEMISKFFPHQLIPHTVVISPMGEVLAYTSPEAVTALVVDSILTGKEVHLPKKVDVAFDSHEALMNKVFPLDKIEKDRFLMQQEIKGAPGFSTTYPLDSTYNGRRITAINLSMSDLYRLAYGNVPYKRMMDKTAESDRGAAYCLDIIVKDQKDLLPTLKAELLKRFDVQARMEIQQKTVHILRIVDAEKFKTVRLNVNGKRTYYARHGEIDQQGITMGDFARYLESFGTEKLLVIDETGNSSKFDIKFTFQPENPATLTILLKEMGLGLLKEQRGIEFLVIYR